MSEIALTPILRQPRRWSAVALAASLAVNAFFLGAAATHILPLHSDFGPDGPRALRFELHWLESRLPSASMEEVRNAVGALRPSAEAHIERMRSLRRGLGTLVAQPNPDRAAIEARLADIRSELQAMQAEVQGAVVDTLLKQPLDVRAKLAEASGAASQ
jgi:uncharacterized membrane protein